MIPKIIHQTGPEESKWHPIWKECSQSWKNTFPDFQYMYWTDDDLRNLVKEKYSEFLELYDSFNYHIMRVDFARFCILHSCGGIYADLDFYCHENFYHLLKKDLYIVESWPEWGEKVQNSLMISSPNHAFWEKCMRYSQNSFNNLNSNHLINKDYNDYILSTCGPKLISKILDPSVKILPKHMFNPWIGIQFNWSKSEDDQIYKLCLEYFNKAKNENKCFTTHFLTGNW